MGGWDWGSINVLSGEWWLLLLFLLSVAAGFSTGYALGARQERRRLSAFDPQT